MTTNPTRRGTPEGIIPPVLTPLTADGRVDAEALRRLLDQLIETGVHGLFVAGTCGFGSLLTTDEYVRLVRTTVDHVGGRLPVLAGVLESSTCRVVERLRLIEDLDISSAVLVLPYYLKASTDCQKLRHFEVIRNSTELDLTLYNIPGCVGMNLPIDMVLHMFELDWIGACKDSSGDREYFHELCRRGGKIGLSVYQGLRPEFAELAELGAAGCVPVPANVNPEPYVQAWARRNDSAALTDPQKRCDKAWIELVTGADYFSEGLKRLSKRGIGSGNLPVPFDVST